MNTSTTMAFFCGLIGLYSTSISATDSLTDPLIRDVSRTSTVCQWLSRDGRKLYLCGIPSDVDAMIQEARHYQKSVPPIEKAQEPISMATTSEMQKKISENPIASPSPSKKTSYLVQAIGETKNIIGMLKALKDKDYQVFKSSKLVSLGIFGKYENALGRQRKLASLGIDSKLIDRAQNSIVQIPEKPASHTKQTLTPIKEHKEPLNNGEKQNQKVQSNNRGFLVASIEDAIITLPLLALAHDKHFQILRSAPHTNKVSLGIYNGKTYAIRRQNNMLEKGIGSIIINRDDGVVERTASITQTIKPVIVDTNLNAGPLNSTVDKTTDKTTENGNKQDHIAAIIAENLTREGRVEFSNNLDRVIQLISSH
ncbi:MAG: hypothetical protein ACI9FB_001091 [Candidatus Azotimanducaceae bacterium]|jgi:hypothetical protein